MKLRAGAVFATVVLLPHYCRTTAALLPHYCRSTAAIIYGIFLKSLRGRGAILLGEEGLPSQMQKIP